MNGPLLICFEFARRVRWLALVLPLSIASATVSDSSIYLLGSKWTTDDSQSIQLKDLSGQYQVLAFIFTNCGGACPLLVKDLQRNADALPEKLRTRVHYVLVTMDPQHDSPAALRRYRQQMKLSPQEWTLLHGAERDVRELAAAVGFSYERTADDMFTHSNVVTLLDPRGEVLVQTTGASDAEWARLRRAIESR